MPAKIAKSSKTHHSAQSIMVPGTPRRKNSFAPAQLKDSEENIIPQIMNMLTGVGFLHLRNVPGFNEDELLSDIKEFHGLPEAIKKAGQPQHINKKN